MFHWLVAEYVIKEHSRVVNDTPTPQIIMKYIFNLKYI